MNRREALAAGVWLFALGCGGRRSAPAHPPGDSVTERFVAIERTLGGRLGVAAIDTGSAARIAYRATERFPMCSTFKLALVAAILARVDAGDEKLERRIAYDATALLEYAPITKRNVGEGAMTIADLCDATITWSDNTAANLLLETTGGPAGMTRWLRSIGDTVTRLDRNEPTLNTAVVGDERDTTTPDSMSDTVVRLATGDALRPASRERLVAWLVGCKTGLERLRAGLPETYRVGDKTGTGENGALGDVAVAWPPGRAPIVIAMYAHGAAEDQATRRRAFVDVAGVVRESFDRG